MTATPKGREHYSYKGNSKGPDLDSDRNHLNDIEIQIEEDINESYNQPSPIPCFDKFCPKNQTTVRWCLLILCLTVVFTIIIVAIILSKEDSDP